MIERTSYRKISWLTDWRGIKHSIGESLGWGFPEQPSLNKGVLDALAATNIDENWITNEITMAVMNHPLNTMEYPFAGERIYDHPLIDFIAGDDPIFNKYKEIIGPHHLTPYDWLAWQARNNKVTPPLPQDISVVSFILPMTENTITDNVKMNEWPAERWAQTRLRGELFMQAMVREIITRLMQSGILAVAPDHTPLMRKKRYPNSGWASPWSHRHVAYAAGLGTFGLHDFLITEKGAAHRCGSFIVNLKLKQIRARQSNIHAYCLNYNGYNCQKCATRCPVGAISASGHSKDMCYKHVSKSLAYVNKNYHIFAYSCGLCSVSVPCMTAIPQKIREKYLDSENI